MVAEGGVESLSWQVSRKLFDFAGMADSIGNAAKWCQDTVNQAGWDPSHIVCFSPTSVPGAKQGCGSAGSGNPDPGCDA